MTSLLRASEESETRILTRTGAAILVVVVGAAVFFAVNPFGRGPKGVIAVTIETPYVGLGVAGGTPVIMHGVKVGEVKAIFSMSGGRVRLNADLQSGPTTGLTDAMGIDFRPANYFGVTGINLIPTDQGRPLQSGMTISVTPKGNFVLEALLYRLGELSNQVITPRLVNVIERATRFTDALNPLLETMVIVSTTITNVQTVSTEQLLRNTTGIAVALPGLIDAAVRTGDYLLHNKQGTGFNAAEDYKLNPYVAYYDDGLLKQYHEAATLLESNPDKFQFGRVADVLNGLEFDLFGAIGKLESSHIYELAPVVDQTRVLTDVVPKLVPAGDIANTLHELRTRLEHMYAGSGEQRALQVRVILDALPGVAGPMSLALGAAG
jgi:hypothetical protein